MITQKMFLWKNKNLSILFTRAMGDHYNRKYHLLFQRVGVHLKKTIGSPWDQTSL